MPLFETRAVCIFFFFLSIMPVRLKEHGKTVKVKLPVRSQAAVKWFNLSVPHRVCNILVNVNKGRPSFSPLSEKVRHAIHYPEVTGYYTIVYFVTFLVKMLTVNTVRRPRSAGVWGGVDTVIYMVKFGHLYGKVKDPLNTFRLIRPMVLVPIFVKATTLWVARQSDSSRLHVSIIFNGTNCKLGRLCADVVFFF